MCPQPPRLSPEYSHKAALQTVITGMPLQIRPVTRGGHAGPVTMGRITRGPLSWTRPHGGMTTSQAFVWCRIKRRVSLPVLSSSDQRLQRRPRAKGGVFAFAPTVPIWTPPPPYQQCHTNMHTYHHLMSQIKCGAHHHICMGCHSTPLGEHPKLLYLTGWRRQYKTDWSRLNLVTRHRSSKDVVLLSHKGRPIR
jgi:hypothetical protein